MSLLTELEIFIIILIYKYDAPTGLLKQRTTPPFGHPSFVRRGV
jgi:hypothetical protein